MNSFITKLSDILFNRIKYYNVGIINQNIADFILDQRKKIFWLNNLNKNTFIADPFVHEFKSSTYIFVEEYCYSRKKGHISVIQKLGDKLFSKPVTIIEEEYHLSYPFIFCYEEKIYCMPEAYKSGETSIYEAIDFPYKWEKKKMVFNEKIIDPTLIHYKNKWWCFYTLEGNDTANSELHIKYTEDPINGEWKNHKMSPAKRDIKSSRSAGNFILMNNSILRPSQDCEKYYGHQISVNKIMDLTESSFEEKTIKTIHPNKPYLVGFHHISHYNCVIAIDGMKYKYSLKKMNVIIKYLLQKITRIHAN